MAIDLNKIYNELLGRSPDTAGKNYWQNQFDTGSMTGKQIRESIKQSPEYLQPRASNPNKLTVTGINPTFSPATVTAVGGGGGDTSNIITTGQRAAPSWNVATRSIADPYASDPNYTTTAPTGIGPHFPIDVGGKTYYKTGSDQTISADLDPVYSGYRGAAETGYTRTVPTFTGSYRKDSKNDRSAENLYQQNILDELTKYAQQSGLGNFAISDGSTPQWMPTDASRESIIDPHYRNQASRATEDLWQQGQISDLEKWAANITGSGKYDLSFTPSEAYLGMNKAGTGYSEHLEEGKRRNISQSAGIDSLIDFISKLDTARGPELSAEKDRLSGIYGAEIDRTYNELFETDTGIDQAGKEYWTKDLIENRPGLAEGQDWQTWLSDAFKNTHSYKDWKVNQPLERIDISDYVDVGNNYTGGGSTGTGSALTDYSQQLQEQKDSWDIKFDDLTSMYTDQINDLKAAFEKSNRDQAALFKGYQDQVASYRADLNAQAAYGERPMNQTVKGVKTKDELPGFKPSTGGTTGHFNRAGSRLTTKSLNVA